MDIDRALDEITLEKKSSARPARTSTRPPAGPRTGSGLTRGGQAGAGGGGGGAIQNSPYTRPTPPRNPDAAWTHDLYNARPNSGAPTQSYRSTPNPVASSKIMISNIHYEVTESDLKNIFQRVGTLVAGPKLRYDRSGRSMGVAFAEYTTPKSARDAINQFDGNLAKGQALQIKYDDAPPRRVPAQAASGPFASFGGGRVGTGGMPAPGSLLNRIDGGRALANDGGGGGRGGAREVQGNGVGSGRGQGGPIGGARMGRGLAPGNAGRGRGGASGGRPAKAAPKTADDLDKELDGYHGNMTASATSAPAALADGDVEMS